MKSQFSFLAPLPAQHYPEEVRQQGAEHSLVMFQSESVNYLSL